MDDGSGDITKVSRIVFDPETGKQIDYASFDDDPTFIITGVDLTQSQDWKSSVNRFFNNIAGQTGIV